MVRVSVVMPTYNAEATVLRAIDAARAQTLREIEIVVVDDASTDGTVALVEERQRVDPRIRVHRCERNGGPSVARNIGLAMALGEWIGLLDADDWMASDRLEAVLTRVERGDVMVADNLEMYDLRAGKVVKLGVAPKLLGLGIRLDAVGFVDWCRTNRPDAVDFGLLKPLMRREHLVENGLRYDEGLRHGEDFRFYLDVLVAGGRMVVFPEAYYRYTEPWGSVSRMESGESKTGSRLDALEAQTRRMAADPRYASVAWGLTARANAIGRLGRVLGRIDAVRARTGLAKILEMVAMLAERDVREHYVGRLKMRLRGGRG